MKLYTEIVQEGVKLFIGAHCIFESCWDISNMFEGCSKRSKANFDDHYIHESQGWDISKIMY